MISISRVFTSFYKYSFSSKKFQVLSMYWNNESLFDSIFIQSRSIIDSDFDGKRKVISNSSTKALRYWWEGYVFNSIPSHRNYKSKTRINAWADECFLFFSLRLFFLLFFWVGENNENSQVPFFAKNGIWKNDYRNEILSISIHSHSNYTNNWFGILFQVQGTWKYVHVISKRKNLFTI